MFFNIWKCITCMILKHSESNTFYNYFQEFFYWILYCYNLWNLFFFFVHWHKPIFMYSKKLKNNQDNHINIQIQTYKCFSCFSHKKERNLQETRLTVIYSFLKINIRHCTSVDLHDIDSSLSLNAFIRVCLNQDQRETQHCLNLVMTHCICKCNLQARRQGGELGRRFNK